MRLIKRDALRAITKSQILGGILVAAVGAYLGAVFVRNPGSVLFWEGDKRHDPSYVARVSHRDTWTYTAAVINTRYRSHPAQYGEELKLVGYCIGAPVKRPGAERGGLIPDERWLVLSDKRVIPAVAVQTHMPFASLEPKVCPGASQAPGPSAITLTAKPWRTGIALQAQTTKGTTVGFVLFDSRTRRWRQIGLVEGGRGQFSTRTAYPFPAAAMAVACWAQDAPAHPQGREAVHALQALGRAPENALAAAAELLSEGEARACSLPPPAKAAKPNSPHRHPTKSKPGASTAPVEAFEAHEKVTVVTTRTKPLPATHAERPAPAHRAPEVVTVIPPLEE